MEDNSCCGLLIPLGSQGRTLHLECNNCGELFKRVGEEIQRHDPAEELYQEIGGESGH